MERVIKKAQRQCPVCNNNFVNIVSHISMYISEQLKLPNNYDIVCCEKCGFCYADTSATNEDYNYYYSNCNTYSNNPKTVLKDQRKFDLFKDAMKKFLKNDSKLINIGIGDGQFEIDAFKQGYMNIIGMDPSESSVLKLKNNGINSIKGNIYNKYWGTVDEKYDAVIIIDVLEHLLEPRKAIEQIKNHILEDGKLFIAIPNYESIDKEVVQLANNFNQEHINYFSRTSLNNLLSQYGFKEAFSKEIIGKNVDIEKYSILSVYINNSFDNSKSIKKDNNTVMSIEKYINRENKNDLSRTSIIENLRNSGDPIIIWGTGAFTMNLLATTVLNECNIINYVDNNKLKIGSEFCGKKVMNPNTIKSSDATLVICSMMYSKDIEEQIRNMGLTNKVLVIK